MTAAPAQRPDPAAWPEDRLTCSWLGHATVLLNFLGRRIVTDPALMVIPFDDHMVHRGHGVFDTAAIVDGKIYDLEAHLDRFVRSATTSRGFELRSSC